MSSTSFATTSINFSIYAGLSICIFGILGNLINLRLLFSNRSNSCSLLLFVSSFFSLFSLLVGLLPRILVIAFNIDFSSTSLIWCKSRLFISYTASITTLTCICFASIDRLFVSCRSAILRNQSKLSTAKTAILIVIPIAIGINVPFVFFYTIVEVKTTTGNTTTRCSANNPGLVLYLNYFIRPVLCSILAGTILSITGWLTYRNITSITNIQLRGTFQRGLTSMILLQTITVVIPIIPFATMNIYQVLTSSMVKTSYRLAQESLVLDISNIILYISYASNFYVYLISASSYRRDFLRLVLFFYSQNHWNNHVEPMPREQLVLNTVTMVQQLPRPVDKTEQRTICKMQMNA